MYRPARHVVAARLIRAAADCAFFQGRRGVPGGLSSVNVPDLPGDSPPAEEIPDVTIDRISYRRRHPYPAGEPSARLSAGREGAGAGARPAARHPVLVKLRISRPLYALGHGLRRPAAG